MNIKKIAALVIVVSSLFVSIASQAFYFPIGFGCGIDPDKEFHNCMSPLYGGGAMLAFFSPIIGAFFIALDETESGVGDVEVERKNLLNQGFSKREIELYEYDIHQSFKNLIEKRKMNSTLSKKELKSIFIDYIKINGSISTLEILAVQ